MPMLASKSGAELG